MFQVEENGLKVKVTLNINRNRLINSALDETNQSVTADRMKTEAGAQHGEKIFTYLSSMDNTGR